MPALSKGIDDFIKMVIKTEYFERLEQGDDSRLGYAERLSRKRHSDSLRGDEEVLTFAQGEDPEGEGPGL